MDAKEPIRRTPRGETGSAYIVALMALVILTILGLALAFITQTEVQLGANEKSANRTFYAADAGIEVAAAQALSSNRYSATTILLNETEVGDARAADRVRISQITPILRVRCDWCPSNDDGLPKFWKIHNALAVTSERITWTGSDSPPAEATLLGQKTLSVMYEFQPLPDPPVEAARDNEALERVKF